MIERHKKLIYRLISEDHFMSAGSLAALLQVSERTIRVDVKSINELLFAYDAQILSSKKDGYCIEKKKRPNVLRMIGDLKARNKQDVAASPSERIIALLNKLSFHQSYLTKFDLAEALYVSIPTIDHDIRQFRAMLKDFPALKIMSESAKGIKLIGPEESIRDILSFVLTSRMNLKVSNKYIYYLFSQSETERYLYAVRDIVFELNEKFQCGFTDYGIYSWMMDIFISIKRNREGFYVNAPPAGEALSPVVLALDERLIRLFGACLAEADLWYLHNRLKAKRFALPAPLIDSDIKRGVRRFIAVFLEEISRRHGHGSSISFKNDAALLDGFAVHLAGAMQRVRQGYGEPDAPVAMVKERYGFAYDLAEKLKYAFEQEFGLSFNPCELSYIALYLAALCHKEGRLVKIMLYAPNMCTANHIKSEIKRKLPFQVSFIHCYSIFELDQAAKAYMEQLDLILLTATVLELNTATPVIQVSPLITEKDLKRINAFFNKDI